jgi:GNAT superfamily N-acetyltransferase
MSGNKEANLAGPFSLRPATLEDTPVLKRLIGDSVRGLSREEYTPAQIEAALGTAFGVDSELIRDGTYFVVEAGGNIIACGGWSKRTTLFGSDAQAGRESALLDPGRDSARIRAFFVHPDWARRGVGRLLLAHCEQAARAGGFRSTQLMATLPGRKLYAVTGYSGDEVTTLQLPGGEPLQLVPMTKSLV